MKLPFTSKNKRKNTNLKFEFKKLLFWTPKEARFWFFKNTDQQHCFKAKTEKMKKKKFV